MPPAIRFIALALALLQPYGLSAADPVLFGALERVLPNSVAFRLADGILVHARLPDTVDLTPESIAAKYHVADQVQFTFRKIESLYDAEAGLHLHLEVKRMRLVRPPTPREQIQAVRILSREPAENLLQISVLPKGDAPAEQTQLQHVREVNLDYATRLPNFMADETAKRYTSQVGSTEWRYFDTVEAEVAVNETRVSRQRRRRNGKPYEGQPPGFLPNTGFGAELRPLFDPACPTKIALESREQSKGAPLLAFGYSSPHDGCFSFLGVSGVRYNAARTGRALVSESDGNLLRFEEEAFGFPEDFGFDYRKQVVTWDRVKIGDTTNLAPVAADFVWLAANGQLWHVAIEYRNHRKFEASSNVKFGTEK
jgi:hypothetical protein